MLTAESLDEARAELEATVPESLWWRIDIDPDTGCLLAVRGGRSGCNHRYPALGGRLLHRAIWEAVNGPTDLLIVRTCWQPLCVRLSHTQAMGWSAMHLAWRADRGLYRPAQTVPALSAPNPPTLASPPVTRASSTGKTTLRRNSP